MNKEDRMTERPRLIVRGLRARGVMVELDRPLQASGVEIPSVPLVLIDLFTEEGVAGRSYLFCYTPLALNSTVELVSNLGALLKGEPLAPQEIEQKLVKAFRLLGPQGLTGMAMAGVDMACWDALAKACGLPLVRLLGGEVRPVRAYGSLRAMEKESAIREVEELAELGFDAFKVKIGRSDIQADLEVIHAMRNAVAENVALAVDYNQSLSVTEALRRLRVLDEEGLFWIEEPTRADDFAGHARISREIRTPICIGENWWGPHDTAKSMAAGASDHGMPDAMKIGGVTGWLRAAALAEAEGLPLSSHVYPEISAHLLAVTPTAYLLEYLDFASPILQEPMRIEAGHAIVPDRPGIGLEWDEEAVSKFLFE